MRCDENDYVNSKDASMGWFGSLLGGCALIFAGFKYDNWWLIGIGVFCLLLAWCSYDSSYD